MERRRPEGTADEKAMLAGWLAWQHQTVDLKCAGLSEVAAHQAPIETSPEMSVAALVSHLTVVERDWIEGSFLGEIGVVPPGSDGGWDVESSTLSDLLAAYRHQGARTQQIIAEHPLDQVEAHVPEGLELLSLRWIVLHLIEETGRHLGHLDVLREIADGSRGQ